MVSTILKPMVVTVGFWIVFSEPEVTIFEQEVGAGEQQLKASWTKEQIFQYTHQ